MNNKKTTVVTISATLALILLVATATFAYFQADLGNNKEVDVSVSTLTENDRFSFAVGDPLALQADETSFVKGGDSVSDTTTATALLTANNKTNNATKYYYLYLLISQNEFLYSQNENTPELLLTITDASGNAVTSISGLTYKTVTDGKGTSISGFDITTKTDLITLFDNREITANPTKTDTWNITVTFVNYNANQTGNTGKSFNAKLMIQQESQSNQTLADYVISQYTGTQGENGIYYHNSTLTNGAGDNSYRYAGANPNNYVCFGSDATTCPEDNLYRIIGVFDNQVKLIKATLAKSNLLGTDGEYSSDTSYNWSSLFACPSSTAYNLNSGIYQLANKKSTVAAVFGCNKWKHSELNTINLNTNFLNNISSKWVNMIEDTTWKVGGNIWDNIALEIPSVAYTNEITSPVENTTYSAKIGLMYANDYGFSVSPSGWTLTMQNYNNATVTNNNWLFLNKDEWSITRNSSYDGAVFIVKSQGAVDTIDSNMAQGVRPVFYLKSSVTYAGGLGTYESPIILSV